MRRGHLTDIKKNQSLLLGRTVEWNSAAGSQWACGSFYHTGSMPGCHSACCVSSQLGRMEGGINEEEEKKEIVIQGGQIERVQLITGWCSSHLAQQGNWSLGRGQGSQLRMSQKRYKLWRKCWDLNIGDTQWETKYWKFLYYIWLSSLAISPTPVIWNLNHKCIHKPSFFV